MSPADLAALRQELANLAADLDVVDAPDGKAIALLRDHGMLGYLVPARFGGMGGDVTGLLHIAHELGAACPAVAVLWVMHCQQVAVLDDYAPEPLRSDVLRQVAARQWFLGSVTTEPRKGGHLLTAEASMRGRGNRVAFRREAPVVTGGVHADAFLVTVRRGADAAPDDVVLVYCDREQSGAQVVGMVDMLGMRATGNVSLTLDVDVPAGQVIDPAGGFARITMRSMAPLGHLGWAACWIGAARELLRGVVRTVRAPSGTGPGIPRRDFLHDQLARVRGQVDFCEALVLGAAREYRQRRAAGGGRLDAPDFQILVNNVKLVVSEQAFDAVNRLMEAAGMGLGYRRDSALPIERTFRDLRSASLMYANERLLAANGRLALMDLAVSSFPADGLGAAPLPAGSGPLPGATS